MNLKMDPELRMLAHSTRQNSLRYWYSKQHSLSAGVALPNTSIDDQHTVPLVRDARKRPPKKTVAKDPPTKSISSKRRASPTPLVSLLPSD